MIIKSLAKHQNFFSVLYKIFFFRKTFSASISGVGVLPLETEGIEVDVAEGVAEEGVQIMREGEALQEEVVEDHQGEEGLLE